MLTHTTKFALHVSRVDTEAVASYSVKQHMLTQAKKTNVSVFCIDAFGRVCSSLLIVQLPN